jgi:hypothetical protein
MVLYLDGLRAGDRQRDSFKCRLRNFQGCFCFFWSPYVPTCLFFQSVRLLIPCLTRLPVYSLFNILTSSLPDQRRPHSLCVDCRAGRGGSGDGVLATARSAVGPELVLYFFSSFIASDNVLCSLGCATMSYVCVWLKNPFQLGTCCMVQTCCSHSFFRRGYGADHYCIPFFFPCRLQLYYLVF